jgi:hypothetical protein
MRLRSGRRCQKPADGSRYGTCSDLSAEDAAMTNDRKSLTRLIQDAIDRGARTVEDIHKSIADLPLKILEESSDLLRKPAREVRRIQDRTIGAVYDLIREINQRVGRLASDLLAEPAKHAAHTEEEHRRAAAR